MPWLGSPDLIPQTVLWCFITPACLRAVHEDSPEDPVCIPYFRVIGAILPEQHRFAELSGELADPLGLRLTGSARNCAH